MVRKRRVGVIRQLLAASMLLLIGCTGTAADISGSYFAVIVSDIDASTRWYRDTFNLDEQSRHSAEGRFEIVNLGKDGLFIELLQLDAAQPRPEGRLHGPFKLGLLVADLGAFIDALPDDEPAPDVIDDESNKLRLLQLRDPDGNIVQVMQQNTE